MGCSSLNIDGVSKRVVYSESVKKMLQNGIENPTFLTDCYDRVQGTRLN